jgi:TonB dependent receptor/CarboxypepD_reg-like domain/TonB-dependent Receptor Plug Domain
MVMYPLNSKILNRMRHFFFITYLLLSYSSFAQQYTISGYIKDAKTGETVIGANIYDINNPNIGTVSNLYGFYSITLLKGNYDLKCSYLGFTPQEIHFDLDKNIEKTIELTEGIIIKEVVITAKEKDHNVKSTEMGTVALPIESIKKLPAIMGEVDILKALQLLPGVMSAGEGSAGFYVRGGGPDQNLVLLDEATVYNPGHLLGFFSVFNADAIKNTTLIKGGMPAQYGGRLSSVVDIQMNEGNNQNFGMEGGVGLIASRFTIEGPIKKNKSSFILSARRTYVLDLLQPVINKTKFAGTNYYFYDLNAKFNYTFSDKDKIFFSSYFGRDKFIFNSNERDFIFEMPYGNSTATARWNHVFNPRLFMNASLVYNDYNFNVNGGQREFQLSVKSGVRDWNAKLDFDYFQSTKHTIKYGFNYTYHRLSPNIVRATNGDIEFTNNLTPKYAHEYAIYGSDEFKINARLSINYGLRLSAFTQVGPYNSSVDTSKKYGTLEPVKTYTGIEPRVNVRYILNNTTSLKAAITRSNQYLHLVSNSTSTLPVDVWVPSTELVKPQLGLQFALGYFKNFKDNNYEFSIETYYKDLQNQIDYPDNYVNNASKDVEQSFVFGKGRAYGVEFFLKKSKGKLNGWIGYTIARTERSFPDIENGKTYPSTYDRTHDVVVVANYNLSKKWDFNANFTFATGNTFTPLRSLYFINQNINIDYGSRNSVRLPSYHRMDVGVTYTPNPNSTKKFKSSWTLSVYNVYNRLNPFFVYYNIDTNFNKGNVKATAFQVTLFPIIPSVTWNFKFK